MSNEKKEFVPLVSDAMLSPEPFWAFNEKYQTDLYHTPPPLTPGQVRDLYEADRAASREIIEKLLGFCVQAKDDALDAARSEPGSEINEVWFDGIVDAITEARAFLNKNVKP